MKKKKESILVFCAHSDDQIFGPGATLAKYAEQGKEIYTIILSYGEAGLPWLKKEEAIKTRVKESEKADKIIGGRGILFLGLKEGKFLKQAEFKEIDEKIKHMINKIKPAKIFTHNPEDPHPDHRASYKIMMKILEDTGYSCEIYAFDIWNPFTFKRSHLPKLYVDVSDTFQKKIKALKCFPSQFSSLLALFWSVYVRAIAHGLHIQKRYAERFFKIR
ncbi:hypothetical protein GF336_01815 [Candidatus Woesearchaeota archaeon]|nr:hypothetical protein [Candidatus Woesearchaeota archaeon]